MDSPFIHLHTHSEFSLADGATRIKDLVKKAKGWGQSAVALTDHGNMFGAVTFYSEAKKEGLKPILGAEIYLEPLPDTAAALSAAHGKDGRLHPGWLVPHLVLLAKDAEGHQRLMKIISDGYLQGLNGDDVPVVSRRALRELADGRHLFALSACGLGELGVLMRLMQAVQPGWRYGHPLSHADGPGAAVLSALDAAVDDYLAVFGDSFFIELIDNGLDWQAGLNDSCEALAAAKGLPLVATGDAHYLDPDFRDAHSVLLAIKSGLTLSAVGNRERNALFHLQTPDEMARRFARFPEALANTVRIAEQCNVKLEFGVYHLPRYNVPGETSDDTLRRLARAGLDERFHGLNTLYGPTFGDEARESYRRRLEYELDMIIQMGFPGYFLIVQDFINWAKDHGIPVGPGRGSGAGSLVAYALRITDLDPIRYSLIFERFLNPERVSMPDFDVDFCQDRRDEVIQYVIDKYGAGNVAQIITFGEMKAKAAIKAVGRAMGLGYNRVDRFTKLVPLDLNITLTQALEKEPRLGEALKADEELAALWDIALKLEGLKSHTSVHAAGVVISDRPMIDYVPVYRTRSDPSLITQYEMKNVEKVGLVKFDFLGLKTLTVIQKAVQLIQASREPGFDIALIPMEDKAVYDLISTGKTTGIFQLEGTGMQNLIVKLKPSRFEDIIALVALFRPGPLGSGMVDDFIERKHGRAEMSYPHPLTETILEETYGVILYQEQVQKIATVMASYTLGEADLLRRAMGKKIPAEMQQQRSRFLEGCTANQIDGKLAGDLFDLMAKFAEYGFNKSHSAAYGLVSYQTAYLKTHFPEEFMAAIMTCDMGNTDKVVKYIDDCRRLGITVKPPCLLGSGIEFKVGGPKLIHYGLGAIKGIGEEALRGLIGERDGKGRFRSLGDICRRVNLGEVGKKNLEVLVMAGALDEFHQPRALLLRTVPVMVDYSLEVFGAKERGQRDLFGSFAEAEGKETPQDTLWEPSLPAAGGPVMPNVRELLQEKKLVGHFLSSHPMHICLPDARAFADFSLQRIAQPGFLKVGERKANVKLVGIITDVFERLLKSGARAAVIRLEDAGGSYEAMMFERDYLEGGLPKVDDLVILHGDLSRRMPEAPARFVVKRFDKLEEHREEYVSGLQVRIPAEVIDTSAKADQLVEILKAYPGDAPVQACLVFSQGQIDFDRPLVEVALTHELLHGLALLRCDVRYTLEA